jgi:hypothetical protein
VTTPVPQQRSNTFAALPSFLCHSKEATPMQRFLHSCATAKKQHLCSASFFPEPQIKNNTFAALPSFLCNRLKATPTQRFLLSCATTKKQHLRSASFFPLFFLLHPKRNALCSYRLVTHQK